MTHYSLLATRNGVAMFDDVVQCCGDVVEKCSSVVMGCCDAVVLY